MLRLICALLLAVGFPSAAAAASLAVTADKTTYNIGETVTLTVTGDDAGATAYSVFGQLRYSGLLVDNGTRTQTTLIGVYGKWLPGFLDQGDNGVDAFSWAFNQITGNSDTATNLPGLLATVTLIAQATGTVNVSWDTTVGTGELRFFGVTNPSGTSFTIVPEPAAVVLLGLGLLALAAARRST